VSDERPPRAAIVAVQLPDTELAAFNASVAELGRLARTLGLEVVAQVTQRRAALHAATVVGSGKLSILKSLVGRAADAADDEDDDDDDVSEREIAARDDDLDDGASPPEVPRDPVQVVLVDHDI